MNVHTKLYLSPVAQGAEREIGVRDIVHVESSRYLLLCYVQTEPKITGRLHYFLYRSASL